MQPGNSNEKGAKGSLRTRYSVLSIHPWFGFGSISLLPHSLQRMNPSTIHCISSSIPPCRFSLEDRDQKESWLLSSHFKGLQWSLANPQRPLVWGPCWSCWDYYYFRKWITKGAPLLQLAVDPQRVPLRVASAARFTEKLLCPDSGSGPFWI